MSDNENMKLNNEEEEIDNLELDNNDEAMVTLELDDGSVVECAVLTIFPVDDKDYIALLPIDSEDADDGEVFLYRYVETEDGQPSLDNIQDDDEYEAVADAFDELLDSQEYDEIIGEDEVEE